MALANVKAPIDYLNTHGTATPLGDIVELNAVRERSEEHTSELQSLMRISYAVFCLKKKKKKKNTKNKTSTHTNYNNNHQHNLHDDQQTTVSYNKQTTNR